MLNTMGLCIPKGASFLFFVAGCLASVAVASEPEEPPEPLYQQLSRTVVRLEEHQSVCTPGREWSSLRHISVGSGFFVRDRVQDKTKNEVSRIFLVTARHVVEDRADLFARVRKGRDSEELAVLRLPRKNWTFHPGPNPAGKFPIDVAVIQVPPSRWSVSFRFCDPDRNPEGCGTSDSGKTLDNQVGGRPAVMERAVFFGFPGTDAAMGQVEPFVRSGVVAYTAPNPAIRIDGRRLADSSVYSIDAPSFPGNSGGPVMRERAPFRGGVELWGLVTGSHLAGRDYTLVTPPERIVETITHARATSPYDGKLWQDELPSIPIRCVADKK